MRSPLIGVLQTVDVGCGIGGSSRHIAAKYGSSGKGVTLSPVQVGKLHCLKALPVRFSSDPQAIAMPKFVAN